LLARFEREACTAFAFVILPARSDRASGKRERLASLESATALKTSISCHHLNPPRSSVSAGTTPPTPERDEDVPDRPLLFLKPPNSLAGHGDSVRLPENRYIEHEAELAVVIGEQCRNVSEDGAKEVIAGYTCFNDLSNRDDQDKEQNWVRGKAFDNAAPMGPVLATPEEVPDDARIQLRVDGETRQDSTLDHLIFSIPELIAEITQYMTLEPGDVIATGTPEGVGPLDDGNRVEVEIEGIGTLSHTVRR
jgi:2-keto-4-pentenoate hydratase/2-oxohepta-3-ene-1,7-dioic acid hydratase in catechol pathway